MTLGPPEPPIPSFVDGKLVQQGKLNAIGEHLRLLYANQVAGFRTVKPICVIQSTGGAVAHNTTTFITFQTQVVDTDSMFSAPGQIIQVRSAGVYLAELHVALDAVTASAATPYISACIFVNGTARETDLIAIDRARYRSNAIGTSWCGTLVNLDVGAYVRFAVVHTAGTGISAAITNADGGTRASLEWIGALAPNLGALQ